MRPRIACSAPGNKPPTRGSEGHRTWNEQAFCCLRQGWRRRCPGYDPPPRHPFSSSFLSLKKSLCPDRCTGLRPQPANPAIDAWSVSGLVKIGRRWRGRMLDAWMLHRHDWMYGSVRTDPGRPGAAALWRVDLRERTGLHAARSFRFDACFGLNRFEGFQTTRFRYGEMDPGSGHRL